MRAGPGREHLAEILCNKGRGDPNCAHAAIRLDGVDMSHKLTVVGTIVNTITLKKCKELLLRSHRGHHTLRLGVIRAT